jgi:hypothetical protein
MTTPTKYDQKMNVLSFEIVQLVLTHCSETFGHDLKEFKLCQSIIDSELKNYIPDALDHYLNNKD